MKRFRSTRRSRQVIRPALAAAAVLCSTMLGVVGANPAAASTGQADITSAGPLTLVSTTNDLNCNVMHTGDTDGEFYDDTACGTFVTDGTSIWGPADVPAGPSDGSPSHYHAWTPVSQSPVSGAGSAVNPFKIVTVATGGPFTVTQTDTYIVGNESYQTDIQVQSSTGVNAIIYRAADCYLQDSDEGLGRLDGTAVTCLADPSSANPDRVESWYPLTPGSNYMEDEYSVVWDAVTSMLPFPNTVLPGGTSADVEDNGAGLSWSKAIPAGGSTTVSHLTTFSPLGALPLTVTKTVDVSNATPGQEVHYTITVTNPNSHAITIDDIVDTMPAGFGYKLGSTTGVTTADPTPVCNPLRWAGPFVVPAMSGAGSGATPGTVTLTFTGIATTASGTYTNSASAHGPIGVTIVPATDTAPLTVGGGATTTTTMAPVTTLAPTSTTSSTTSTTVQGSTTTTSASTSTTLAATTTTTTVAVAPAGGLAPCSTYVPPAPPASPVHANPTFTG